MYTITDTEQNLQMMIDGCRMKIMGDGEIPDSKFYFPNKLSRERREMIKYITICRGVKTPEPGHAIHASFPHLKLVSVVPDKE